MLILKFGGTSVASASRIKNLADIVYNRLDGHPVVIVSALAGVTELLIAKDFSRIRKFHSSVISDLFGTLPSGKICINYLDQTLNNLKRLKKSSENSEVMDQILAAGELLSSFMVSQYFNTRGMQSRQIAATDLIVTDNNFGSADFLPELTQKQVKKVLLPVLKNNIIPVVTGFIGATHNGKTTTLGRGGSDYTASILGYCLNAEEVQIWTDVDGIFSCDPKVVKKARLITRISYKEASEMAAFGAKVLHPRTIRPALQKNIPVRLLNSFNPKGLGTLITQQNSDSPGLKAVAFKRSTIMVNIYSTDMLFQKGYLAKVFDIFAQANISIDLVSVSEVSVSVTLDNSQGLVQVIHKLKEFSNITTNHNVGIISLIGEGVTHTPALKEISSVLFNHNIDVKMISLGASDVNISLVLATKDIKKAVQLVHDQIVLRVKI